MRFGKTGWRIDWPGPRADSARGTRKRLGGDLSPPGGLLDRARARSPAARRRQADRRWLATIARRRGDRDRRREIRIAHHWIAKCRTQAGRLTAAQIAL